MSKRFVMAAMFLGSVTVGSVGFADEAKKPLTKEEAQAKVDAAKTDVCEKGKKFLAEQKAKGRCAAESDEAAKVTCSAATSKSVTDLMTKCTSGKPADAKDKPADASKPNPDAAVIPKCHAVEKDDATKLIAEAEDKSIVKCTSALMAKVKEAKCSDVANKGKKINYTTQFDHMIGKGPTAKKMKDGNSGVTCPKK